MIVDVMATQRYFGDRQGRVRRFGWRSSTIDRTTVEKSVITTPRFGFFAGARDASK
jgi:hypothetical protein